MPSQDSSDTGFWLISVFLMVVMATFGYFYGIKETPSPVVEQEPANFVPRQFVPHEREADIQAAVSRSQEREKKPKPKPTPAPTATPTPTATPKPSPKPDKPTGGVPALLQVIIDHESGGNYRAYNPTGCSDQNGTWSCGGKYQLSSQYAAGWAANNGYPGQSSNAAEWAPEVQDAVALALFHKTNGGLWCNYTSYC